MLNIDAVRIAITAANGADKRSVMRATGLTQREVNKQLSELLGMGLAKKVRDGKNTIWYPDNGMVLDDDGDEDAEAITMHATARGTTIVKFNEAKWKAVSAHRCSDVRCGVASMFYV